MSEVRPAATVVLLRDGDAGLETLMLRRDPAARFLGGYHVFPGGAVGADDADPITAAIRETFEECGMLLARDAAGATLSIEAWMSALAERGALHAGAVSFGNLLAAHALSIDRDAVVYFDRWLTPPDRPRRFDTRFYMARAPQGQHAAHDGVECVDARWVRPALALDEASRGAILVANATTAALRRLATHATADEALRAARATDPPS
jgi:8-oxo-dGTP pyrophosphatase MutT (NUDIX family)